MRRGTPIRQPTTSLMLDGTIVGAAWGFLAILVAIGMLIYGAFRTPAKAHEWYPAACCSSADCVPLAPSRVHPEGSGYLIDGAIYVPQVRVMRSQDGRYHGCFPSPSNLRCFFAPPSGS